MKCPVYKSAFKRSKRASLDISRKSNTGTMLLWVSFLFMLYLLYIINASVHAKYLKWVPLSVPLTVPLLLPWGCRCSLTEVC